MVAIMPQKSSGRSVMTCGPGRDALDHHRADHQRHHRIGRDAQGQQRNERSLRAGVVGGLRRRPRLEWRLCRNGDGSLATSFRARRPRRTRAARRRRAGCRAPSQVAVPRRIEGHVRNLKSSLDGNSADDSLANTSRCSGRSRFAMISREAEHPHRHRDEADAVGELRRSEGEARNTGIDVGADQAEQQARATIMPIALQERSVRQHHRGDQAQAPSARNTRPARTSARPRPAAARRAR